VTGTEMALAIILTAWCLWWICRDAHAEKVARRQAELDAHIAEALATAADEYVRGERTPIFDQLAERRESFNRDLTRVHQLDTYQPDDWGGDTA
jgi:hypothetical protein